jgi:hypothetical protein
MVLMVSCPRSIFCNKLYLVHISDGAKTYRPVGGSGRCWMERMLLSRRIMTTHLNPPRPVSTNDESRSAISSIESCSIIWRPFSRARAPASIRSHFMLSENCGPIWSAAFYPTAFFGCVALTATKVGRWPFRARAAAFAPVAWLYA